MSHDDLTIIVYRSEDLPPEALIEIRALFDKTYDAANHAYLIGSIDRLGRIAVAWSHGRVVGFAVGNGISAPLPRFADPQAVALAGIGCTDPTLRKKGLFRRLSLAALTASGIIDLNGTFLMCGRMAHPVTYRAMARFANNVVPAPGQPITSWHTEMLIRVAELYGVNVDPNTGAVIGKGTPIGYPRLTFEASEEDLRLFTCVNRDRGDALLALSWAPTAPEGWL